MIHFKTADQKRTKKAVAAILDAAGLTQSQLAEMIGVSLSTVKSWTRKKNSNPISSENETRILVATGAVINADGTVITSWRVGSACGLSDKPFTKEAFDFWTKKVNTRESVTPEKWIEPAKQHIELLLKAAIKGEAGKGRQTKFPALLHAFEEWADKAAKEFNLERQMLALSKALPKEKRYWRNNLNYK